MDGEGAALAGLTADQRSTVQLFREISANARDVASSVQLLQSCGFNTERALELHWAAGEDEPMPNARPSSSSAGAGSSDRATPLLSGSASGGGGAATTRQRSGVTTTPPASETLTPPSGNPLLAWLGRSISAIASSLISVLRTLIFGVGGGGMIGGANVSGAAFRRTIVDAYGGPQRVNIPQFFEGSFGQAVSAAKQQTKLLVVYLHSDHARYTQNFVTSILSNEFVQTVVDESFIVWGGDIAWMESHLVSRMVHARQYPHFSVLLPASADDVRVIGAIEGNTQVDGAIALLSSCLDEMDSHVAEMVARREQYTEDRSLREAQDEEYIEAMALDRKREEEKAQKLKEEQEMEEKQREMSRKVEEAAAEAERKRQEIINKRKEIAVRLGAETAEATARLSLRLPAGQQVRRKLRPTDTLAEVYSWADSCAYLPENQDRLLEVPLRFVLKTSFPSRELTEMDKTIQELNLAGSNIMLTAIEDDD